MPSPIRRIALAFILLFALAATSHGAEQKLGFATDLEAEGFFLNPIVRKIRVTDVTKGSIAEAAGIRAGDLIIQIEGQTMAGKRALDLRPFMKLDPGQTRSMRLKHADGTEFDVRLTKPKT
jgi:C-terminal processing protease CtpA/Prc